MTVTSGEPDAATAAPAALTFAASDWNAAEGATDWQTVTVTAPQDDDATDETVTVDHDLEGHGRQTSAAVTVTVDDDDTARVAVEPLALALQELGAGNTGTYRVRLDTRPEAEVTVTAASGDPAAAAAAPAALTFAAADWDTWQTVTVTAVPDVDGDDEEVSITHAVAGYAGVTAADPVTVTVTDYGAPGVTVEPATLAIGEGGAATYTVVLDGPPVADVTVQAVPELLRGFTAGRLLATQYVVWVADRPPTACCLDTSPGAVRADSPSPLKDLTFTPGNWNREQTVTVTAVENPDSAEHVATITHRVRGYGLVTTAQPVTVSVTNNDVPGVEVTPRTLSIREGASDGYVVRPHTWPGIGTGGILRGVVTAASDTPAKAFAHLGDGSPASSRWTGVQPHAPPPRIFTVTAHADDDADNETVTITHAVTGWGGEVTADPVTVTVLDPDVAPPTGVQAAAGPRWLTASWQAPVYTGFSPVVDYLVRWQPPPGDGQPDAWRGASGDDPGLVTKDTIYTIDVPADLRQKDILIQVAARNGEGNVAWAEPVTGRTAPQTVEFVDTSIEVDEGEFVHPKLRRSGDLTRALLVDVSSSEGTAKQNRDYAEFGGVDARGNFNLHGPTTFEFPGGAATTSTFSDPVAFIQAFPDAEVEGDETFTLTIVDPGPQNRVGAQGRATVTIKDRTPRGRVCRADVDLHGDRRRRRRVAHRERRQSAAGVAGLRPLDRGNGRRRHRYRHRRRRRGGRLHRAADRAGAARRRRHGDHRRADHRRPPDRGRRDLHRDPHARQVGPHRDRFRVRSVPCPGRTRHGHGDHRRRRPGRADAGRRRVARGRSAGRRVRAEPGPCRTTPTRT